MKIERTKSGLPALWESGGGSTSTGMATIVAGRGGVRLRPIYVRRSGELACGQHALLPIEVGSIVITVRTDRSGLVSATIEEIERIDGSETETSEINYFIQGEWNHPLEEKLTAAVEAAITKAMEYHCRRAYYIAQGGK